MSIFQITKGVNQWEMQLKLQVQYQFLVDLPPSDKKFGTIY